MWEPSTVFEVDNSVLNLATYPETFHIPPQSPRSSCPSTGVCPPEKVADRVLECTGCGFNTTLSLLSESGGERPRRLDEGRVDGDDSHTRTPVTTLVVRVGNLPYRPDV